MHQLTVCTFGFHSWDQDVAQRSVNRTLLKADRSVRQRLHSFTLPIILVFWWEIPFRQCVRPTKRRLDNVRWTGRWGPHSLIGFLTVSCCSSEPGGRVGTSFHNRVYSEFSHREERFSLRWETVLLLFKKYKTATSHWFHYDLLNIFCDSVRLCDSTHSVLFRFIGHAAREELRR